MHVEHDHESAGSDTWMEVFGIFLDRRRNEILSGLLKGGTYSRALDVGCGGFPRLIQAGQSEPIGIDISRSPGATIRASAEFLPFTHHSFDLVFAGEVIEHLLRPSLALRDWVRVLKPGGTMIISTPNGVLVKPEGGHPEHKFTFATSELKKALRRLGLKVDYARGIYTGLFSGKRVFGLIRIARLKRAILRFPVPLRISYDVFIRARKSP